MNTYCDYMERVEVNYMEGLVTHAEGDGQGGVALTTVPVLQLTSRFAVSSSHPQSTVYIFKCQLMEVSTWGKQAGNLVMYVSH